MKIVFLESDLNDKAIELQREMDTWTYGVIQDGKTYLYDDESINDVSWDNYRTQTLDELSKSHTGTCWDFVNYEYDRLKKLNANPKAYMMILQKNDNKDDSITHTFITYNDGKDDYWLESSWWSERGVHKINSINDVIKRFTEEHPDYIRYDLYEYDPTGMDGLANEDYFNQTHQKLVDSKVNNI